MTIGAIAAGWLQDRFGRRVTLASASILSAIAVAICFVSNQPDDINGRRGLFLAGKLIQGFAIGGLICAIQTWMSEVVPAALRGPIMALFPIFTLLGQLVGAVVVFTSLDAPGQKSYNICFISQWPFSAIALIMGVVIPESPTWLVRKGRLEDALKSQTRLDIASCDSQATVEQLRVSIEMEMREANMNAATYSDCFRDTNRRRTWIVSFANILRQLFGIALLANASYFLQIVGMPSSDSILFLIAGIALGLISNTASFWILLRVGRRKLILITLTVSTVLWFALGIAGCFKAPAVPW